MPLLEKTSIKSNSSIYLWIIFSLNVSIGIMVILLHESNTNFGTYNNPVLHGIVEFFGAIISIITAILLYQISNKLLKKDKILQILYGGLVVIALFNLTHSFLPKDNLFVFTKILGIFTGGILLLSFFLRNYLTLSFKHLRFIFITTFIVDLLLITRFIPIPIMLTGSDFTLLAKIMSIVGGVSLLAVSLALFFNKESRENHYYYIFAFVFANLGMSALMFPYSALEDLIWWVWHGIEFISFSILFWYSIKIVRELIENINFSQIELIKKLKELEAVNKIVQFRNKELSQFTYIATHDLQEPLNTIAGYSNLILRKNSSLDDFTQKSLHVINDAALSLKKFIKGLSEYSRIGESKKLEKINFEKFILSIARELEERYKNDDFTVTVKNSIEIAVFKKSFTLLMNHLLSNAIKYKKENTSPVVFVEITENIDNYIISVKDNGIGIPEEYKNKVFEIFQRLHTRDKYEGSGIGLAFCKKVAELHQGDIWVKSVPDVGSTFYVTITKF